jgi:hypothetical protein
VAAKPVVVVKFRRKAAQTKRCAELAGLVGPDLAAAEPLFPGETEPELASLFQVTLRQRAKVRDVVGRLQRDKRVEYAHEPAERSPKAHAG